MVAWSLVMAVILVIWEVSPRDPGGRAVLWGLVATASASTWDGAGMARQSSVAPIVVGVSRWVPLWIAAMFRHGFLKGLFVGSFW